MYKTTALILLIAGLASAETLNSPGLAEINVNGNTVTVEVPKAQEPGCECADVNVDVLGDSTCHAYDPNQICEFNLDTGTYTVETVLSCGCTSAYTRYTDTQQVRVGSLGGGGKIPKEWREWRNSLDPPMGPKPEWQMDTDVEWYVEKCRIGEWLRGLFQ